MRACVPCHVEKLHDTVQHDHPIAEGPLVNVYRAVYNGQDVAVKIIKNPADQEARESFLAFMAYATCVGATVQQPLELIATVELFGCRKSFICSEVGFRQCRSA